MLTEGLTSSVRALFDVAVHEAIAEFGVAADAKGTELNGRGLYRSSVHIQAVDKLAQQFLARAADSILGELLDAHAADPIADMAARTAQLVELLNQGLEDAATAMWAARDARLAPLTRDMPNVPVSPASAVLPTLKTKGVAKLNVGAVAISNRHRPSVSHSINVSGPVGSIQTGSHATAHVTQTVDAVTSEEVRRALGEIAEALGRIQDEKATQALELVDDLKAQITRDKPNSLKVSSALGGLATMIQTIPAIAPAWETVVRWSASLAALTAGLTG